MFAAELLSVLDVRSYFRQVVDICTSTSTNRLLFGTAPPCQVHHTVSVLH